MDVVQVEFRRVRNLGNYETAELKLVAVPSEGEDFKEVIAKLKSEVLSALGLGGGSDAGLEKGKNVVGGESTGKSGAASTTTAGGSEAKDTAADKSKGQTGRGRKAATTPTVEEGKTATSIVSKPAQPVTLKLEDVKAKMKQVVKEISYDTAIAILKGFGVAKSDELDSAQYELVMAEAEKALSSKAK